MLLESYTKEIFRPECNPGFQSVHCIAHLDQDVGEALPYLNAELGGFEYFKDPPTVMFRVQGKIICATTIIRPPRVLNLRMGATEVPPL